MKQKKIARKSQNPFDANLHFLECAIMTCVQTLRPCVTDLRAQYYHCICISITHSLYIIRFLLVYEPPSERKVFSFLLLDHVSRSNGHAPLHRVGNLFWLFCFFKFYFVFHAGILFHLVIVRRVFRINFVSQDQD